MPINDMMKLQGVGSTNRLAPNEQAVQLAKHKPADSAAGNVAGNGPTNSQAKNGIAVEVGAQVSAGEPPVSNVRISEVRDALQDRSYQVTPAAIVDAMIAAQLSLVLK